MQRVVIGLIFLSVGAIILETVHPLYEEWQPVFDVLEWVFFVGFGLEYVANIYVAEDRRAYLLSFWGVIDLLAVVPSIAGLVHITGLQELRTLRVLRVLRTLKLIKLAAVRARESSAESEQHHSTLWLDISETARISCAATWPPRAGSGRQLADSAHASGVCRAHQPPV